METEGNTALALAPNEQRGKGLALRQADPMAEWTAMREQAAALVKSGFLPKAVNTPEKAIAIIQTGRELGIGPMQALRCVHIIDGKPTMAAELIAGLVLSRIPGAVLQPTESTNQRCVVVAARPGGKAVEFRFGIDDAKAAGLLNKDNWRKYPRAMLRSRAITEAARAIFPDATMGLYDPDELGAVTSQTGEVMEWPAPGPVVVEQQREITHEEAARAIDTPNPEGARRAVVAIGQAKGRDELEKVFQRIKKTAMSPEERAHVLDLYEVRLDEIEQLADDLIGGDDPREIEAEARQPGED